MGEERKTLHANGLRIATRCETAEQFVAKFHRFCEDGAIFIPSAKRQVGIDTAFSFDLIGGQPALCGLGTVLDHFETHDNRFGRPGIVLGISRLQANTKRVFDDMLVERAVKAASGDAPRDATPPPARRPAPDLSPAPAARREEPGRARATTDPFAGATDRITPTPQAKARAVTSAIEIVDSVAVKAAMLASPKPRTRTAPIAVVSLPTRATGPMPGPTSTPAASERHAQLANASSTIPRSAIPEEPPPELEAGARDSGSPEPAPRLADSSRSYAQAAIALEPEPALGQAVPAAPFASPPGQVVQPAAPRARGRGIPGGRRLWRIAAGLAAASLIGFAVIVVTSGSNPRTAEAVSEPASNAKAAEPSAATLPPAQREAVPADDPPPTDMRSPAAPDSSDAAREIAEPDSPPPQQVVKPSAGKKPIVKKAVVKKRVAHKPVAKKPVAKKPVAKKPVAKKPGTKKPAAKCASLDCM
jgi:hypothetical protein